MPAELIWLPDIILYNKYVDVNIDNISDDSAHGSPAVATMTKAYIYSHGEVVFI
jgi:hypothetical protein